MSARFGAGYTHYVNTAIPTTDAPNNAIYAFWDDLNPAGGENGNVYVQQIDANRYVIQWQRVRLLYAPDMETFEIVLNRSDGTVLLQYQSVANTGSATVGIEEADGRSATQYCFNTSDCVTNGLALLFTPRGLQVPRPVVSPSSFNISLAQGEYTSRQMTIGNQGQTELSFSLRDVVGTSFVGCPISSVNERGKDEMR